MGQSLSFVPLLDFQLYTVDDVVYFLILLCISVHFITARCYARLWDCMSSVRPSVTGVTLRYVFHTVWNTSKLIISRPNSLTCVKNIPERHRWTDRETTYCGIKIPYSLCWNGILKHIGGLYTPRQVLNVDPLPMSTISHVKLSQMGFTHPSAFMLMAIE